MNEREVLFLSILLAYGHAVPEVNLSAEMSMTFDVVHKTQKSLVRNYS
jgi:hypothetical protein